VIGALYHLGKLLEAQEAVAMAASLLLLHLSVFLLALIHRNAWNRNSANFAFWGFSEVRQESCNKYCN
jgi:hypothetical protein